MSAVTIWHSTSFQSTLPVRGATGNTKSRYQKQIHFNPRSPCGERPPLRSVSPRPLIFQSTLPVRGATTFPLLGGQRRAISIHAPRAGSDAPLSSSYSGTKSNFNPRSPCGERRLSGTSSGAGLAFQSTLPVRGATRICWA